MNKDKNFIVWVNEEDHIRIISMQKGASLKQVWGRLVNVIDLDLLNLISKKKL